MNQKDRLFEMMEKVNPDFNINELYDNIAQKSPTAPIQQSILILIILT